MKNHRFEKLFSFEKKFFKHFFFFRVCARAVVVVVVVEIFILGVVKK